MTEQTLYDAIIVGGGPAGLSVASELSRTHRVLVVEKGKSIEAHKRWFVPGFVFDDGDARDILQFTDDGPRRFLTQLLADPDRKWPAHLEGGYRYIREDELLGYWAARIREQGSEIELDCCYFDHDLSRGDGGSRLVEVSTSKGARRARLLVDASGHDSLIRAKYELDDEPFFWWSVYGAQCIHPNGFAPGMEVGDYLLWGTYRDTNPDADETLQHGRPVFEYELHEGNESFPLILYLRRNKVSKDVMATEFDHVLRHEARTKPFHDAKIVKKKWGWYPSGGVNQDVAEDHVVFIGDAGCWTTPCGWGMTFIVANYKDYASHLAGALSDDRLDRESLLELIDLKLHAHHEILLDKVAVRFLSHAPASALQKFVTVFGNPEDPGFDPATQVPFYFCERLFTLTVTHEEVLQLATRLASRLTWDELRQLIPLGTVPSAVEEAGLFFLDWLVSALEGHHGELRPGFDIVD